MQRLDAFLQFNERNVLTHVGTVSHQLAEAHVHAQFEQYDAERRRLEAHQPSSDCLRAMADVKRPATSSASARKRRAKIAVRKLRPKGS